MKGHLSICYSRGPLICCCEVRIHVDLSASFSAAGSKSQNASSVLLNCKSNNILKTYLPMPANLILRSDLISHQRMQRKLSFAVQIGRE